MTGQSGGGGAQPWSGLWVNFDVATVPTDGSVVPLAVSAVRHVSSDFQPTVLQSQVQVLTPGWYHVHVESSTGIAPQVGAAYHLIEGDNIDYSDATPSVSSFVASAALTNTAHMVLDGYYLFTDAQHVLDFGLFQTGSVAKDFSGWMVAAFVGLAA